jgi:porin
MFDGKWRLRPGGGWGSATREWPGVLLIVAALALAGPPALAEEAPTPGAPAAVVVVPAESTTPAAEPVATEAAKPATAAAVAPAEEPARPAYSLLETPYLLGDWGGARPWLADHGVKVTILYAQQLGTVLRGPDVNGGTRCSGSYDFQFDFDLEKMGVIPGGRLFIQPKGHWNRNINPRIGALSDPVDDADGTKSVYINNLWYEQAFLDRKLRWRFGYIDSQAFIDRNAYANSEDTQFMATYLDNNNATIPIPTGLGTWLAADPAEWLGLVVGAVDSDARLYVDGFDTAFHGDATYCGFFEATLRTKLQGPRGELPGNYRFGTVYDARRKFVWGSELDGRAEPDWVRGDWGFYLSFDQLVYRENDKDKQGLGLFARYGVRRGTVNRIGHFWSTGAEYLGLVPTRDKDRLGFGVYQALGSHEFRRDVNPDFYGETGYELYYDIHVTPWLSVAPDVQFIHSPGGLTTARDAIILAFRARIVF